MIKQDSLKTNTITIENNALEFLKKAFGFFSSYTWQYDSSNTSCSINLIKSFNKFIRFEQSSIFYKTWMNQHVALLKEEDIEYCLLATNGSSNKVWFWGRKHAFEAAIEALHDNGDGNTPIKVTNDSTLLNHGIHVYKPGFVPSKDLPKESPKRRYLSEEDFIKRIKEDLKIGMLKDTLEELIKEADVKQIICHGAPGTGKTFTITNLLKSEAFADIKSINKDVNNIVQFHPAYDYTDFVEGMRPVTLEENDSKIPTFVRMDGIFKRFCREVIKNGDKTKKYLFIIDEINRADLSKVFGELMYCLDEDNRSEDLAVPTQYANMPCYIKKDNKIEIIKDDVYKQGFYIPKNVIIVGIMNDIDRSVDTFDFAMQRRFHWINVDADVEMTEETLIKMWKNNCKTSDEIDYEKLASNLRKQAKNLNEKIVTEFKNESYKIGHAYYKKFANYYINSSKDFENACEKVWKYSLSHIISSYRIGQNNISALDDFKEAFMPKKEDSSND